MPLSSFFPLYLAGLACTASCPPSTPAASRGPEDVAALAGTHGVTGAVVGTALYEGRTILEELLRAEGMVGQAH